MNSIVLEHINDLFDSYDLFSIVAAKYKTPFLPKGEDAQKEISEYESECRKQYPEIDAEKIKGVFSTVCWLANR